MAAVLAGVLALQLGSATPVGAAAFGPGSAKMPPGAAARADTHHDAPVSSLAPIPSDDPAGPMEMPMPCEGGDDCDWGLMRCDGAGTCAPVHVLPATLSAASPAALTAPLAAESSSRPPGAYAPVHRPPPKA